MIKVHIREGEGTGALILEIYELIISFLNQILQVFFENKKHQLIFR